MSRVWLSAPHMDGNERKYMLDAFDSNWIAPLGPYVDRFEQALSNELHGYYVAALSSGTAALHLALILLGVQPGDLVICQSFTFSASANPIDYMKAVPIFVDSETDTWNMDPNALRAALLSCQEVNQLPKAVIVVHLYGMPAQMEAICLICEEFGVPIIEDAAEALGSTINGKKCGTFGAFGILSFNGNKIITTSGGGALVSNNQKAIEKARFLATQARDQAAHYQHSQIGYNYRLSNICAAIGCGQLEQLHLKIAHRRENFNYYKTHLRAYSQIKFLDELHGYFSNRWLTTMLFSGFSPASSMREKVRIALQDLNIESRPLWKPMHLQPVFAGRKHFGTSFSERLFDEGLCLPSGSDLDEQTLFRVTECIKEQIG